MEISPFVDRASLLMVKDNLANVLREDILSGKLKPGEAIVEGKWARHLGVAQTSVREAINILTAEGFVQKGSGRSARVTKLSHEDVAQIYEVRSYLESLAAKLAAEKRVPLGSLRQIVADMHAAADQLNLRAFYERDLQFHLSLAAACGNRILEQTLRRIVVPLFAFVIIRLDLSKDADFWRKSIDLHRQILDAIESGDTAFAEHLTRRSMVQFHDATSAVIEPSAPVP
jgi:DNA-binding GntR family transcriptional regulator